METANDVEIMSFSSSTNSDDDIEFVKLVETVPSVIRIDDNNPTSKLLCNHNNACDGIFDESQTCSICFEPWTSSGSHRICCLKCGHLFGKSCLLKWLNGRRHQGKCPQCNSKAMIKDIRELFCKKIVAEDTTNLERVSLNLKKEQALRRQVELELSEYKFKFQLVHNDSELLREELTSLRAVIDTRNFSKQKLASSLTKEKKKIKKLMISTGGFELLKSMLLSQSGKCRVMAACDYINLLCVSQPSINSLFKGFGIRKIHTGELRPFKYIHLHSQPIRDLSFHPNQQDGFVASASLDKSLKLTSLLVDQNVQTYQCPAPVWSCCWGSPSPNYLFAGCANGSVLLFDIRVTSGPIDTITIDSNSAPITALQYLSADINNTSFKSGGLLVGQLTQVSFLEEDPNHANVVANGNSNNNLTHPMSFSASNNSNENQLSASGYKLHPLPLEGSLVSLSSISNLRMILASYRPSQRIPRVRHIHADLVSSVQDPGQSCIYTCNELSSFYGGTQMRMLSRANLFHQVETNQTLVVAGDDDTNGAIIWNCVDGVRLQVLIPPNVNSESPVIDVCAFDDGNRLALLTNRELHLYAWSSSPTCVL